MIVQNILITWLAVTGLVFGQTSLDWDGVKSQQVKEVQQSVIDIKVHDFYNLRPDVNGDYHIELNGSNQTLIRLEGRLICGVMVW